MSWILAHHAHKSLSKEEATEIYRLTREIMQKENISGVPLIIKSGVWKTAYRYKKTPISPPLYKIEESIQLGSRMLTGSLLPSSIYYISLYDPDYKIYSIKSPRHIMMATIVASIILEEIAHCINRRANSWNKRTSPHGVEFLSVFRELWKKYFIILQFKLQNIYGSEGDIGEKSR